MANRQGVYLKNDIHLDNDHLLFEEALFHNANGYIGIRSAFEEGYPQEYESIRGHYINGFYDFVHVRHAEILHGFVQEKQTMLNIADIQSVKIYFGDEAFSMFEGEVLESRRWVDMDKGVTGRYVLWESPKGKKVEFTIVRMASFDQLSLFTIDYKIRSINFSGEVRVESDHCGTASNYYNPNDPRVAHPRPTSEPSEYINPTSCIVNYGSSYITSTTSKSNLEVCSGVKNFLSGETNREHLLDDSNILCRMITYVEEGATINFVKYAVFADSIRSDDCQKQAILEMKKALSVSMHDHYQRQEDYLSDYWENCFVEIEENDSLNTALKYNLFQMIQSVSKDEYGNISPKGLSGEGYEGHYFWDSEMYIQPFFTITNPEITKRLISNRYNALDMAKVNARILGHKKGALYPWRTIMGKECSGYYPSGSAQYHINGDIAYAIVKYYLATDDVDFMAE
ncbi:MAG TPA: family 65 glycosyl hydrolase, partial [Eubacteriaceae bacterium]|nr:family 65 glycosyl hydrolase [Eubacteriaceae bacterium]